MKASPADTFSAPATGAPATVERRQETIRVLHLDAGNLYGGVEAMLVTLASARGLRPRMEPHFAVCYEGRLSRELMATGVPVHLLGRVRMRLPWTAWRARRRLQVLLQQERFDLVVCHMDWSWLIFGPIARAAGNAVALWTHGFPARRNWLDRMAARISPDAAIANSRFTASFLERRFPDVPREVIYCPVAASTSPDAGNWRTGLRRQFAVGDDTPVIIQVSRLEAWKGHSLLLEGLSKLKQCGPWVCWIVGGPQKPDEERYFEQLQALSDRLGLTGRIRFLGQRADVPKLLAAADIFCQPNLEPEPFGMVFVEALSAGRPVVTTAMGGALEIVDESCGLLTKPRDPDELALALRRLIESPELRSGLGRAGAARARQLCDPMLQMAKLEAVARGRGRHDYS
ncbi:MAG TPA: glycosyltransferase family 4 protein [Bryobacteraceae bacterium]|nr:glycosyltransferase family 4 protein [Bryobacteraceae bacterium]